MVFKNVPLEKADFDSHTWEEALNQCDKRECRRYEAQFAAKAKEAEEAGNEKGQEVFTLLGALCSFLFKSEDKDEPFGPMLVTATGRSPIVADFTEVHLHALKEIVADTQDCEMRSRIADILWLRKKDFQAAGIAVDSYLESAKGLESPESWTYCFERIERAFRLGTQLGSRAGYREKVVAHIEEVLDKYDGEDPLYLTAKLMELLLEQRLGNPNKYSALAEKIALKAEADGNFTRARTCWEIKVKWNALAKDADEQRKSNIKAAETYVKEAGQAGSSLVAATWLEKAIQAYRRIGGQKERVDQLHDQLVKVQKGVVEEMQEFSHEMPLGDLIEKTVEKIKGKDFRDAIFSFCLMGDVPKIKDLSKRVEDDLSNYPVRFLFPATIVNEKGKVVGRKPNLMSGDPDEVERGKRAEMFAQAQFDYNISTQALIEPVRRQIALEHNGRINDFLQLVKHSPFVPEGREYLFSKGLHAGFTGDYFVATHLLIPQVENSIRHLLEQKGVSVSKVDDQGIQNERDLNDILYDPALKEIMGEDLVFDLQGLLVERFGSNLRNRLAHGLISDNGFYSVEIPYFWWFTLRLICLPIISHLQKQQVFENKGQDQEGGE